MIVMGWLSLLAWCLVAVSSSVRANRLPYLDIKSQEIDSSEHGGEEGAKSTTCRCGWANKLGTRIVNGTETRRNEFPFMALVRSSKGLMCGGTIISKSHVVTAAHCTVHPGDYYVVLGAHLFSDETTEPPQVQIIDVDNIAKHAQYDKSTDINDIAVLTLKREINFSQTVGPACVPPPSPLLDLGREYVKTLGWGVSSVGGETTDDLRKVDVRIVPNEECRKMHKHLDKNPTQICTYGHSKDSCQGDSGGPVVWVDPETNRYTLVGVVSYGEKCANDYPGVHTRVQAFHGWINQQIKASKKPNSQICMKSA